MPRIGHDTAQGRGQTRIVGHNHFVQTQLALQGASVEWATAAECHENKVARVVTAFHRDHADTASHLGVGHLDNRIGGFERRQVQRRTDVGCNRLLGPRHIQVPVVIVSQGGIGINASQDKIRVGDGRQLAAESVAGWTGIGPGALGADLQ